MKQKNTGERSSWVVFAISFSISLAVLLVVVMIILSATVKPRGEQAVESSDEVTEAFRYAPSRKDALNLLFISCRQRSDEPFGYTLARFDPAQKRLLLIPIPPETVVTVGAKTGDFNRHYRYAGSQNARLAAESLFLCDVERYARIAKPGAVNLIDALGGLEHRFEVGYETDTVSVPSGNHLLSGELLYEIATSPPEGTAMESFRVGLVRELCDQRFTPQLVDRLDYLFEVFWNNTDTDLTQFDVSARKKAVTHFLEDPARTVEVRPLAGTWNAKRTVFTPDETSLSELQLLLQAPEEEKPAE